MVCFCLRKCDECKSLDKHLNKLESGLDLYKELEPMFDRCDTGEPAPFWFSVAYFWFLLLIGPILITVAILTRP